MINVVFLWKQTQLYGRPPAGTQRDPLELQAHRSGGNKTLGVYAIMHNGRYIAVPSQSIALAVNHYLGVDSRFADNYRKSN